MIWDIGLPMTKRISWKAELDMTIDLSTPLASALTYLDAGLSVFPLSPKEKKPPKYFRWESFQHILPTLEQLKSWFEGTYNNNIAIVTGAISRLLVFDIDESIGKTWAHDVIQNMVRQDTRDAISDTLLAETGGEGLHILVRLDPVEFQKDNQ